jgi:hypothetical protein
MWYPIAVVIAGTPAAQKHILPVGTLMAGPWDTESECQAARGGLEIVYDAGKHSVDGLVVRCSIKPDGSTNGN